MNAINKSLLWSVRNNTPVSINSTKNTLEKNDLFSGKLLAVKNVSESPEHTFGIDLPVPTKGMFSQSIQSGACLPNDNAVQTGAQRLFIEGQKRIDNIANVLLPKADTLHQLARSAYENVNPEDKVAVGQAKQNVIDSHTQKLNLQNEAILTFYQTNARLHNVNAAQNVGYVANSDYTPLFSLIFTLSSSFEDVETLLDHTMARAPFLEFAANTDNQHKVTELFQILWGNSRRSLDNEIMRILNDEESFN